MNGAFDILALDVVRSINASSNQVPPPISFRFDVTVTTLTAQDDVHLRVAGSASMIVGLGFNKIDWEVSGAVLQGSADPDLTVVPGTPGHLLLDWAPSSGFSYDWRGVVLADFVVELRPGVAAFTSVVDAPTLAPLDSALGDGPLSLPATGSTLPGDLERPTQLPTWSADSTEWATMVDARDVWVEQVGGDVRFTVAFDAIPINGLDRCKLGQENRNSAVQDLEIWQVLAFVGESHFDAVFVSGQTANLLERVSAHGGIFDRDEGLVELTLNGTRMQDANDWVLAVGCGTEVRHLGPRSTMASDKAPGPAIPLLAIELALVAVIVRRQQA
ncbi:MAG: hypothetical protein AABY18_01395 [Candidatus Thermoplasmatota archaeon]